MEFVKINPRNLVKKEPVAAAVMTRSQRRDAQTSPRQLQGPDKSTIESDADDVKLTSKHGNQKDTKMTETTSRSKEPIDDATKDRQADGSVPFKKCTMTLELAHQRLAHVSYDKLVEMCKRGVLLGLPRQVTAPVDPCRVCLKAKATRLPHGGTVSTEHLRPGQQVHMDFSFFNVISVRGMVAILSIVDAKTRYLWVFPMRSRRPPLDICWYFTEQLRRMGRILQEV